jgi:hypothetical protein
MVKCITNQEKCYTHFTLAEREEIAIGRERGERWNPIWSTMAGLQRRLQADSRPISPDVKPTMNQSTCGYTMNAAIS